MNGKRSARSNKNWRAANLIDALMTDKGWFPINVETESWKPSVGHPDRGTSRRTIYRVVNEGYIPSRPHQFEIAAVFGLLPSHIWGSAPLPESYAYLSEVAA